MKIKNIRRALFAILATGVVLVFGIGLYFGLTMPYPNDIPRLAKLVQDLAASVAIVGIPIYIWCSDHIVGWY